MEDIHDDYFKVPSDIVYYAICEVENVIKGQKSTKNDFSGFFHIFYQKFLYKIGGAVQ